MPDYFDLTARSLQKGGLVSDKPRAAHAGAGAVTAFARPIRVWLLPTSFPSADSAYYEEKLESILAADGDAHQCLLVGQWGWMEAHVP